jgi:hypothetical protein
MTKPDQSSPPLTDGAPRQEQTHLAMQLMAAGVPLTLLLDLAGGLDSQEVYDREPGSADWLLAGVA